VKRRIIKLLIIALPVAFALVVLGLISLPQLSSAAPFFASGNIYYVNPSGNDGNNGTSAGTAFKTIQKALDVAQAGDTVTLAPGTYMQDFVTKRSGSSGAPITVTGPSNAIVKGGGNARIIEINHSYTVLSGFTVDGQYSSSAYRDKLIYVLGKQARTALLGTKLLGLTIRNAGGECVRLRYYVQNSEIANNVFQNCGRDDFPNGSWGGSGKNGEGVYIGTAPEQLGDGKNPDTSPDLSNGNWVHHNNFNTQGNECVDIKEAASANITEYNTCTGQKDVESAGFDSRGNGNTFRYNEVFGNLGAGVRLGGDTSKDGIQNTVVFNNIHDNKAGGVKVQTAPQAEICGNTTSNNTGGDSVGNYSGQYKPTAPCSSGPAQPTATNPAQPTATNPAQPTATNPAQPTATNPAQPTNVPSDGLYYNLDGSRGGFIEGETYTTRAGGFVAGADSSVSNGRYMMTPNNTLGDPSSSFVTYNFQVSAGGDFSIYLLSTGPDGSSDSFFVAVDGGSDVQVSTGSGSWQWKKVSGTFSMGDGKHTLRIKAREDGAAFDKIYLVKGGSTPSGLGDTALSPATGGTTNPTPVPTTAPTTGPQPSPTSGTTPSNEIFLPLVDAYVKKSSPNSTYGTSSDLKVDDSPETWSLIRFQVPQGAPVKKATLKLYVNNSSDRGGRLLSVAGAWDEKATWNSRPALGQQVGELGRARSGNYITADVTSALQPDGTLSLAIQSASDDSVGYKSREASSQYRPQLLIER
jgi:hypothetical protein